MLGWFSPRVFMGPAQRRFIERGLPVFTYHKIAEPPAQTRDPFLYVTPARFSQQLALLRRVGYQSGSLDDVFHPPANPRRAVITFDDGFCSVLENGLAALAQHQFKAIQFIIAGSSGGKNDWDIAKGDVAESLMTEAQIREWLAAGHEIGSHSLTHPNLRHMPMQKAREEIFSSKKMLEDRFGCEIHHFCYPYGAWNQTLQSLVGEAGYRTACTVLFGINRRRTPPFELRRIAPLSSRELVAKTLHRLNREPPPRPRRPPPSGPRP